MDQLNMGQLNGFDPPSIVELEPRISASVMKMLIGEFPDTGFSWASVSYFKREDGVWEPYNTFGEILPACGFIIDVTNCI